MADSLLQYVYVIYRKSGTPCYVGKGKGQRLYAQRRRSHNSYLRRILAVEGLLATTFKVAENLSNPLACELERFLIAEIGRKDQGRGPLVNFTDGGEGNLGWKPSLETRRRMSVGSGRARRGKKRGPMSLAQREAIGNAKRGKKIAPEAAAARGRAQRGIPKSPEWRALMARKKREYWAGVKAADTPENRAYWARNALQLKEARSAKRRVSV